MNELEVILGGGSEEELYLKGPGDVRFTVSGARFASKEVQMVLKNLPTGIKRFYFPHTGNIPILPACALALNPRAQISVFEIDAHDYHSMKRRLVGYSNIEFSLGTDMNGKKGRKQAVIFCISRNTDRLLCFDILERLNKELEDGTPIYILLAKNRQRDMIKKFNKDFSKGQVIDKTREAVLYRVLTKKSRDRWTPRFNKFEVDAIGAKLEMTTRPGVFSNSRVDVGGLALYESVDMQPGEKMLELGCGAGLVSLLTAQRMIQEKGEFSGEVTMVDSCSRAIECSKINLEDLGYEGFTIEHTELFETEEKFDLVVGNPPYYANNRIAQYFIATAAKTLKEGGRLILVSKHGSVIKEMAEAVGFEVETRARRKYDISICRW